MCVYNCNINFTEIYHSEVFDFDFRDYRESTQQRVRYIYVGSPFVPRVSLNFFPVLYFDFRIAGSRPAKCTTGRRTPTIK